MTEFLRTENRFISRQKSHKMVYYKNKNSHDKIEDHDRVQFETLSTECLLEYLWVL